MISPRPWVLHCIEGDWVIVDVDGLRLSMFRSPESCDNEEAKHIVACVNAFAECGIEPADLPKIVEALRLIHNVHVEGIDRNFTAGPYNRWLKATEALKAAAARLPENRGAK